MSDVKILVFDDDLVHHPSFFDGLRATFRFRGDGREALEEVQGWDPDLVLMDYSMGSGPSGAEATASIRSAFPLGSLPILGISTSGPCNQEMLRRGADDAVLKHLAYDWVRDWLRDSPTS
ncbi:MAG: response regulator [Myxococcota bacterium]|nr:response regulator [Myxococcota bacterium]MEE2779987.1 response regulator [Myxococcota bacterium]